MAKTRVYELAKSLNMTNKMLLARMKELDIEVGSHMSSLDQATIDKIKSSIYGKKTPEHEEKRVKKTVIRRRRRSAKETGDDQEPQEQETGEPEQVEKETAESGEPQGQTESEKPAESSADIPDAEQVQEKGDDKSEKEVAGETAEPEKPAAVKKPAGRNTTKAKIIFSPEVEKPEEIVSQDDSAEESAAAEEKETVVKAEKTGAGDDDNKQKTAQDKIIAEDDQKQKTSDVSSEEDADKDGTTESMPTDPTVAKKSAEEDVVTADKTENESGESPVKKKKGKNKKFSAAKIIKLPEKKPAPVETAPPAKEKPPGPGEPGFDPYNNIPVPPKEGEKPKKVKKGKKSADNVEESDFTRKKAKRKTVVEGKALYSDGRGRKGRKGGKKGGKQKQADGQKTQITTPKAIKRRIKIDETIILSELAKRMGIKANDMIVKLMGMGVMATVNQTIDFDTAALVAAEFGFEVEQAAFAEDTILNIQDISKPEAFESRPPVVTIMGHVDHGKTSLLDVIRKSSVTTGEAGGITQHIGAYNVSTPNGRIVFLDTPGHEAFTAMRSRGASVTDIVILVVAADDGVMPQTVEALNHAKAAGVPIIVAVNKIDKEGADPDRVKRELADHDIIPEDWGGDAMFVNVSAKQQIGLEDLLEMILLQSEVLELKADPTRFAKGHVVEAKLDSGRGPLATVLVQAGTLKSGQSVVCGIHYGKIRAMFNDRGEAVVEAGPSIPVEIIGLTGVPEAGDELIAVSEEKSAKQVSAHRMQKARAKELAQSSRMSLDSLFEQIEGGEVKDLNLIIKADVHGSIEALRESLGKLSTDEVKINVVHSATGTVTESDVSLAAVSNAIILGFNVRPETKVREMAKEDNVDMRFYDIIYDAIKDLRDAMVGLMDSTFEEKVLGYAEVMETFVIPKKGTVAGCLVREGKIIRGERVRLLRDGVIIFDGQIASLKRYKDDAKEVAHGYECGIGIENYNDIKVGDKIDCYMYEEIKPTL